MAEKLLSDRACVLAQPKERLYYKNDGAGLRLQVMPNGAKYWLLRYRWGGKESTASLGKYPDVSLVAARTKATEIRELVDAGEHPKMVKRMRKAQAIERSKATFKAVAEEWLLRNKAEWSAHHYERNQGLLRRVLYEDLGEIPIASITDDMLLKTLLKSYDGGTKESARRARTIAHSIFHYAKETKRAVHNPAADLSRSSLLKKPEVKHHAAMRKEDIGVFLQKLAASQFEPVTKTALLLMLYTGLRDYALRAARWGEINFESATWNVPGSRMKSGRDFACPLPTQALDALRELKKLTHRKPESFIFASYGVNGHLAENSLRIALHRLGFKVTAHGFRSTIADILTEKGYPKELVEKILDHQERDKVRAAYVRSDLMPQRRAAMQWFADWLSEQVVRGSLVPSDNQSC